MHAVFNEEKRSQAISRMKRAREDAEEEPGGSFVFFGTPLPDPNASDEGKFVPEWNQVVTDERGRRRFHGAFTGGFSAGYFNTVGSREGIWCLNAGNKWRVV